MPHQGPRDGDASQGAFAELYEHLAPEVFAVFRWVGDQATAEELSQETWLRFWRGDRSEVRDPRAWIVGIARNVYRNWLTRNKRKLLLRLEQDILENFADSSAPVEEPLEKREVQAQVLEAVQQLPDELRMTVLLCYFQQMKGRDAGELLGIPEGTVKSRLHTALQRLRENLSDLR
jgi:RNA polymerase sigma-70 factor, ECF subfamily